MADRKKKLFDYKKNRAWAENVYVVMQLGLTMVGCIIFCFFVGRYLDRLFATKGIFVTIFTILGVAGGANVAYRQIIEITEGDQKKGQQDNGSDDDHGKTDAA